MSEKAFEAKPGDDICNECVGFERCSELEKNGAGVPHNGSRACKNFIRKEVEEKDDDSDLFWYQKGPYA